MYQNPTRHQRGCQVHRGSVQLPGVPANPVPALMHLESLVLADGGSDSDTQETIFDALTVPALRRLRVSESIFDDIVTTISALLARSQCTQTSLHIATRHFPKHTTEPLFQTSKISR
jgi:hypothetical protein